VAKLVFDEDALEALWDTIPAAERGFVERMHHGERPRDLLAEGQIDLGVLERTLMDLARRGAIQGVRGVHGEDRVEEMYAERAPKPIEVEGTSGGRAEVDDAPATVPASEPVPERPLPPMERPAVASKGPETGAFAIPEPDIEPPRPAAALPEAPLEPAPRPAPWKWVALVVVVLGLAIGGFVLWDGTRAAPGEGPRAEAPAPAPPAAPGEAPEPPADSPAEAGPPPLAQELEYGEDRAGIDEAAGVRVAPGQGLLVVQAGSAPEHTELHIDGEAAGGLPARVALSPGRHELEFRRGGETRFRYLHLREGHTRTVNAP
jgi:hypothetical protein